MRRRLGGAAGGMAGGIDAMPVVVQAVKRDVSLGAATTCGLVVADTDTEAYVW